MTTIPSIMSATTALNGRPLTLIDTTTPLAARLIALSVPAMRGGERNPGTTHPPDLAASVNARAIIAKRTEGAAQIGDTDIAQHHGREL